MSLSSIQSSISSVQRDIQRLQRRLSDKTRDEASRSSRVASIKQSITNSTSPSTLQSKLRQIQALDNEIARIQQDKARLTRQIADKTQTLHRHQQDYYNEQGRVQDRLERKQREEQRRQEAILEGLRLKVHQPRGAENTAPLQGDATDYDAFISHASEDKDDLVRPLADNLANQGFRIWYDEFQLKVGDSLRRSIDAGLARSRFGIVVLSPSFFAKNWPQYELDGLVQREMTGGKVILPLWHKVSKNEVMGYSPSLVDKVALNTAMFTIDELASELARVLKDA